MLKGPKGFEGLGSSRLCGAAPEFRLLSLQWLRFHRAVLVPAIQY